MVCAQEDVGVGWDMGVGLSDGGGGWAWGGQMLQVESTIQELDSGGAIMQELAGEMSKVGCVGGSWEVGCAKSQVGCGDAGAWD